MGIYVVKGFESARLILRIRDEDSTPDHFSRKSVGLFYVASVLYRLERYFRVLYRVPVFDNDFVRQRYIILNASFVTIKDIHEGQSQ
jgi:hypothetical protein